MQKIYGDGHDTFLLKFVSTMTLKRWGEHSWDWDKMRLKIPSKLEVAPPPKCGLGEWVIPLRLLRLLEHLAVLIMVNLQPVRELLASLWKKMSVIERGGEFIQSDVWHLKTATHLLNKMYFLSVLFPFLLTLSQFNISQQCNFSIKHDLTRSCFQLWPKIGDEGDKISRKKLARR